MRKLLRANGSRLLRDRAFWLLAALMLAFTALFTLIAMLCQNKAHTTAGCILLTFALLFAGVYISSTLEEPEYLAAYSYTENGVTVEEPEQKNPYYISGVNAHG